MSLVIHGGELMEEELAKQLLLAEFTRYGFSAPEIDAILARAVAATGGLLVRIEKLPADQRDLSLMLALQTDARAAEKYRAQWQRAFSTEEERAADLTERVAFRADMARIQCELDEENRLFWSLQQGGTFKSLLNLLNDHQYIEWMFACFAHQWLAPLL